MRRCTHLDIASILTYYMIYRLHLLFVLPQDEQLSDDATGLVLNDLTLQVNLAPGKLKWRRLHVDPAGKVIEQLPVDVQEVDVVICNCPRWR